MPSQKVFSHPVITWVAIPSLTIFLGAGCARAEGNPADYTFLVGAGFLCDSAESATCPAVARSSNGDSYEMSGAGTFSAPGKATNAAGTFSHKSSGGRVLETGVWIASELVSFDSYGIAPGALIRGGRALGSLQFGPMRSRMFSGSVPAGGRAVFRIRLLPMWGSSKTATLQVNCALGQVPDAHQTEGIRLAFEGGGAEFSEEVSGRALFILARPGASVPPKAAAQKVEANPPPAEVQQ